MHLTYHLSKAGSEECFQFVLIFANYPFLSKKYYPTIFELSSREVSPKLNSHSVFEARLSMSEGCAHRLGPLLVNLSERLDYLNEFEWSVCRGWVENMAVSPLVTYFIVCSPRLFMFLCSLYYKQYDWCSYCLLP